MVGVDGGHWETLRMFGHKILHRIKWKPNNDWWWWLITLTNVSSHHNFRVLTLMHMSDSLKYNIITIKRDPLQPRSYWRHYPLWVVTNWAPFYFAFFMGNPSQGTMFLPLAYNKALFYERIYPLWATCGPWPWRSFPWKVFSFRN